MEKRNFEEDVRFIENTIWILENKNCELEILANGAIVIRLNHLPWGWMIRE